MTREGQLVVCNDEGHEATSTYVIGLETACQRLAHPGLMLPEATQLLAAPQVTTMGRRSGSQGPTRTCTLCGTITLASPRLYHCRCQHRNRS